MKNDDLSWLAAELGYPVLEETAAGLRSSPAARAALPNGEAAINEAAAVLMAVAVDHPALLSAIARARSGERHSALVGPNARGQSFRLLATSALPPSAEGHHIRLTIAQVPESGPREGLVEVAAAVSHEVANAVSAIRGWAELALHTGEPGDSEQHSVEPRDALGLIRTAARSAEQAARSMLALARGQASDTDERPLDLSQFAEDLLHLLTLTAREARVTLDSSIEPALFVRASRAQLFTILFNLLKNAVEACPPGGVVRVHAQGERGSVQFTVQDSGPGFDAAAKQRLFERYYTTKQTGTGLGLALVQSAVEATGSSIAVDSEPGRGTVFRVSLPRVAPSGSESNVTPLPLADAVWNPARKADEGATGAPLAIRVLVVDDDQALREMLATALSLRGADVVSVRSSEEARQLEGHFDVALIDMMLDDCRGDELLAELRQRGVINAAMLVTGTVQKPRLVPGGEPDDWVRKPFEIAHLVERIRRTLERHRMLDTASHTARA